MCTAVMTSATQVCSKAVDRHQKRRAARGGEADTRKFAEAGVRTTNMRFNGIRHGRGR
jgi:hypothetical protein